MAMATALPIQLREKVPTMDDLGASGIASGSDSVQRQTSMKYRQVGVYASPASTPPSLPKPVPTVDARNASYFDSEPSPIQYAHDELPQLPLQPVSPLSPISPRWDASSIGEQSTDLARMTPDEQPQRRTADRDFSDENPSLATLQNDHSRPGSSKAPSLDPRQTADNIENFSRPRKPSIKQPIVHELSKQRSAVFSHQLDASHDLAFPSYPWPRQRGQSVSSAKSASTFASIPAVSGDPFGSGVPRSRNVGQHSRPPLSFNRVESTSSGLSGLSRDVVPWMSGDELRSSFRSQLTASTAQGTYTTERSSVLTKGSSVTSIYANADEPSVEDVMGMYERGFRDDSGMEDNDEDASHTARSDLGKRQTRILEAMGEPMPILVDSQPSHVAPGEVTAFAASDLSSLPRGSKTTDFVGPNPGERDSARSLAAEDSSEEVTPATTPPSSVGELEEPGLRDRYGFRKQNQHITRDQYDAWDSEYSVYLSRRRKKWQVFLKESGLMTENPQRFPLASAKTKRFIRKGIPPEWRGAAWFYYAGGPAILAKHSGMYEKLVKQKAKDSDVEIIERDLHRTFPDNIRFKPPATITTPTHGSGSGGSYDVGDPEETPIIASLRRVLHAFSIYNPRIGYCQSLNFLAGLLLLFVETEEQCFWLLNVITRVYLPGTHETSLEGAMVDLGVLMTCLKEAIPAVWTKISGELEADNVGSRPTTSGRGVRKMRSKSRRADAPSTQLPPITLCMQAWFMSCFIGTLPIESTLRVWDVFFYEGSRTLFRIALAVFKLGEAEIRAVSDPMEMFSVVQAMPKRLLDANGLMEACFKRRNGFGHLSQESIETRRQERRDMTRREREQQATTTGRVPTLSATDSGNLTETEGSEIRRKGTLFGRRRGREASASRAAEVI